jgi:hypothetical protein
MLRTRACRRRTVVVQAGGDEHGGHCGWAPGECCRLGRLLWGTCGALLAVRRRSRRACSAGARSAVLAHTCSARGSGSSGERGCWQERRGKWLGRKPCAVAPDAHAKGLRCSSARRPCRRCRSAPSARSARHPRRRRLPLDAASLRRRHACAASSRSRHTQPQQHTEAVASAAAAAAAPVRHRQRRTRR